MQGWRGIAFATLLGLVPVAAVAQSCDLDSLAMSLRDGRMADLYGCPRDVVARAMHAGEMRAEFTSGPSAVATGAAYAHDPVPGTVIQPGGLARISISEGNAAASGVAGPAVAGTDVAGTDVAGTDAATSMPPDASPADATPTGAAPVDATPAGATASDATPSDATPPDPAPGDATPTDTAADGLQADTSIGDATPTDAGAAGGLPADAMPANPLPTGLLPIDTTPIDNASTVTAVSEAAVVAATAPVPAANSAGPTQQPVSLATMPGWWWGVLLLAAALLAAGVAALVRPRQPTRQRAAWDARVYAKPQPPRQGDAHPVGDIPLAAPPFSIAASLAFGDAVAAGDIPARMKEA